MKQLNALIAASNATLSWESVGLNLGVTLALALVLFFTYRLTYSGVAYSRSFNVSIVMTTMVTAIVMMVIGNNLALSLGMVGALSIVRFRAAVKEPKDIAYLFWGLAIGLAAGSGAHAIAVLGSLAMVVVVILFHVAGREHGLSCLLVVKGARFSAEAVTGKVKAMSGRSRLKMQNTSERAMECVYEIRARQGKESQLVDAVRVLEGVETVNLVAYSGEIGG